MFSIYIEIKLTLNI